MVVERTVDKSAAGIAAAIGEPARARMLYCLLDGHARTSTDLAVVANALEALMVVAGETRGKFVVRTPNHLRSARTCYDHMAGRIAVLIRDRFESFAWLSPGHPRQDDYEVTQKGTKALALLGIDVDAARALRRRFAYACVDWSERCPHIGGSLGNALLVAALRQKWFVQELDSRALRLTALGRRYLQARFGIEI